MVPRFRVSLCALLALVTVGFSMQIGANTWFNVDWTTDFPFKNLMMSSREWVVMDGGNNWDYPHAHLGRTSYPLSSITWDENLYPVEIPQNGKIVVTLMAVSIRENIGGYPFGTFTLLFEGTGEILLAWDGGNARPDTGWGRTWSPGFIAPANVVSVKGTGGTTRHEFTIAGPQDWFEPSLHKSMGILLQIVRSVPADHIRNIRVIMPDTLGGTSYIANHESRKFNPLFINDHRIYDVLRFMDWGATNNNALTTWNGRVKPDHVTQTAPRRGMAYEHMIDLCNTIGADMWLNVPHQADNDYITNLARLVNQRIDPDLRVYVEYSNEIWNDGMFAQGPWCQAQGYTLKFDTLTINMGSYVLAMNKWHVADAYKVYRSCQMYSLFEDVFATHRSRVVNVLASGGFHFMNRVEVNPLGIRPEATARPLYWEFSVTEVDAELNRLIAEKNTYGVEPMAYEGGNHRTCTFNDPSQYSRYQADMQYMASKGLALFNQYVGVSPLWVTQGCFGVKNYAGQAETEAHKFRAILDYQVDNGNFDPAAWAARDPVRAAPPSNCAVDRTRAAPAGYSCTGGVVRIALDTDVRVVELMNARGRIVATRDAQPGARYAEFSGLSRGFYVVVFRSAGVRRTLSIMVR